LSLERASAKVIRGSTECVKASKSEENLADRTDRSPELAGQKEGVIDAPILCVFLPGLGRTDEVPQIACTADRDHEGNGEEQERRHPEENEP
jgi:hypothetical protein